MRPLEDVRIVAHEQYGAGTYGLVRLTDVFDSPAVDTIPPVASPVRAGPRARPDRHTPPPGKDTLDVLRLLLGYDEEEFDSLREGGALGKATS